MTGQEECKGLGLFSEWFNFLQQPSISWEMQQCPKISTTRLKMKFKMESLASSVLTWLATMPSK